MKTGIKTLISIILADWLPARLQFTVLFSEEILFFARYTENYWRILIVFYFMYAKISFYYRVCPSINNNINNSIIIVGKIKVCKVVIFSENRSFPVKIDFLIFKIILVQERFTTSSTCPDVQNCCWWRSRKSVDFFTICLIPWYLKNEPWIKIRDLGF